MKVSDTELYIVTDKGHVNIITKRRPRVTDGIRHPVKIVRPTQERKECI